MNNRDSTASQLKVFCMQNLMLETDLVKLEESGVEIGHKDTLRKDELVDIELFEQEIVQSARKMADFYELYYCLENSIRLLVSSRLREKYGADWWETSVPKGVRDGVDDKVKKEKDSVLSLRSDDPLTYTNFGDLICILQYKWDDFSDTIRSQKAMQQTLSQFNMLRNVIAHSSELSDNDIIRFKLLIGDWLNIQT